MIENVDSLILETINNGKKFRTPAIHTKNQGQIHKFTFYPATKFIPTFRCKFLATSFISMCSITFLQVQEGVSLPSHCFKYRKTDHVSKFSLHKQSMTIIQDKIPKRERTSKTIYDYHTRNDTQKRQRKCQRLFQFKEEPLP